MINNLKKLISPKEEQRFPEGSPVMFSECFKGNLPRTSYGRFPGNVLRMVGKLFQKTS